MRRGRLPLLASSDLSQCNRRFIVLSYQPNQPTIHPSNNTTQSPPTLHRKSTSQQIRQPTHPIRLPSTQPSPPLLQRPNSPANLHPHTCTPAPLAKPLPPILHAFKIRRRPDEPDNSLPHLARVHLHALRQRGEQIRQRRSVRRGLGADADDCDPGAGREVCAKGGQEGFEGVVAGAEVRDEDFGRGWREG